MRAKKTFTVVESEECLYCHGNSNSTGPCPMCGDLGSVSTNARRLDQIALPKLDFTSRVRVDPMIAGV